MIRLTLVLTWLILNTAALAATSPLFIVEENGPRSNRINIVFLSEGYTATDLPSFAGHVQTAVNFLFTREPWQQYRGYCNIYRIEVESNESGTDNGSAGEARDTYFHSGFNNSSVPQLLTLTGAGNSRAYSLLNTHVPEYDVAVVLVNDSKYGGAGGGISTASVHSSSAAIVEHEIGHSFAGLADEYDNEYPSYMPAERPNNTAVTDPALIKWRDWFEVPPLPIPSPEISANNNYVGMFEGSMYRISGWYRPHNNSVMKNLFQPCGQVNRQEFVLTYYKKVSPIESSSPASANQSVNGPRSLSFSVVPQVPSGGITLNTIWKLDGSAIPGETDPTLEILSDVLGNGTHTLTAEVHDPTPFVRNDPSSLLTDTATWSINLTGQLPNNVADWRAAYGSDTDNPSGDGLVNLIKYALGLDPATTVAANDQVHPTLAPHGDNDRFLTLSISRRMRRTDIDYVVEVSSNIKDWFSGPPHTVVVSDTETELIVRDATPSSLGESRFTRLKVVPH